MGRMTVCHDCIGLIALYIETEFSVEPEFITNEQSPLSFGNHNICQYSVKTCLSWLFCEILFLVLNDLITFDKPGQSSALHHEQVLIFS